MATTMITKLTGGRAPLMTAMSFSPPDQAMPPQELDGFMAGSGLNGRFMADLLSSFLAHEQCGFHLYRTLSALTLVPELEERYDHFGEETESHIEILENLISKLGGDPGYVSPSARMVHAMNTKMMEAVTLLNGTADVATQEMCMLESLVLGETKCRADWQMLRMLLEQVPEGEQRDALAEAVDQAESQEDEHIGWATSAWQQMIMGEATATPPVEA